MSIQTSPLGVVIYAFPNYSTIYVHIEDLEDPQLLVSFLVEISKILQLLPCHSS